MRRRLGAAYISAAKALYKKQLLQDKVISAGAEVSLLRQEVKKLIKMLKEMEK